MAQPSPSGDESTDLGESLLAWDKPHFATLHLSDSPSHLCDLGLFDFRGHRMGQALNQAVREVSAFRHRKLFRLLQNMGYGLRHALRIQHGAARASWQRRTLARPLTRHRWHKNR